jgi:hypothetical protein
MKKAIILFSGGSHFFYGLLTLYLPFYKIEFVRYGFDAFRELIGAAQLIFGLSLLIGLYFHKLRLLSSLFLSVLMGGALGTRIYIGDGFLESAPALYYLTINLFIFISAKKFKK